MWDHTEKCYEAFYFSGLNGTRTEDFKLWMENGWKKPNPDYDRGQ